MTEYVLETLFFEDLPLGNEWTTRRRTVSVADITAFSSLSGDFNPLYVDAEYARTSHHGGVIAPGPLVAAIAAGLGSIDVPLSATVGLVGMSWKFVRPVRPGDTIGTRWRLNRKRDVENPLWGLAVWQVDVENQDGHVVAMAEVARLVARRGSTGQAATERTASSRRRRRRRSPASAPAAELALSEPPPEPAPADLPPPSRRRRGSPPPEAPEAVTTPESGANAAAGIPGPSPSRRRRRRRGNGGGSSGTRERTEGTPREPGPAPQTAPPAPGETPPGGLGGVLRRLRGR